MICADGVVPFSFLAGNNSQIAQNLFSLRVFVVYLEQMGVL